MLKARVIVLLTFKEGVLYRTKRFVPDYFYTKSFLGSGHVDEVCCVDVTPPSRYDREVFARCVQKLDPFCPVMVGGHIEGVEDVIWWLRNGADQVLGGWRCRAKGTVEEVAERFGSQVLTMAVDHVGLETWFGSGAAQGARSAPKLAGWLQKRGAGQILLNSVERDGSLLGYDLETLRQVAAAVDCPVIVAGGCGTWRHMDEGFRAGAAGCATSVIHHLTDSSMRACKAWLKANSAVPVHDAGAAA